jgi:hypothetical protein
VGESVMPDMPRRRRLLEVGDVGSSAKSSDESSQRTGLAGRFLVATALPLPLPLTSSTGSSWSGDSSLTCFGAGDLVRSITRLRTDSPVPMPPGVNILPCASVFFLPGFSGSRTRRLSLHPVQIWNVHPGQRCMRPVLRLSQSVHLAVWTLTSIISFSLSTQTRMGRLRGVRAGLAVSESVPEEPGY